MSDRNVAGAAGHASPTARWSPTQWVTIPSSPSTGTTVTRLINAVPSRR